MRWEVVEDDQEIVAYDRALKRNQELRKIFYVMASRRDNQRYVWTDFTSTGSLDGWLKSDELEYKTNLLRSLTHNIRIENIHLAGAITRIQSFRASLKFISCIPVAAVGIFLVNVLTSNLLTQNIVSALSVGTVMVAALWYARRATIQFPELFIKKESNE